MEMDRAAIKRLLTSDISEVIDAGMRAMDQDRTHYHYDQADPREVQNYL